MLSLLPIAANGAIVNQLVDLCICNIDDIFILTLFYGNKRFKEKRTKDFYKYIRITPEEAAIKIKELWLARNDMKLIKEVNEEMGIAT